MGAPRGERNGRWKGGTWITSKGYRMVKVTVDHPCNRCGRRGYAPEHLLVFWQATGRLPAPGHDIHHRDEDKLNNVWSNLEERPKDVHGRTHLTPERAREIGRKGGKATARMRKRARRLMERRYGRRQAAR